MTARRLEDVQLALESYQTRSIPLSPDLRRAAVAAVLRARQELELLFIRRAEHPQDPWSGHMAFPGGRVDAVDPTPLAAAVREAREEVALDLGNHGRLLGELSVLPAAARGRIVPLAIHPFVFAALEDHPPLIPDEREVQEAVWVPLGFFLERNNRETFDLEYGQERRTLPCYHFEGRRIWGLTLKMVDELVLALDV